MASFGAAGRLLVSACGRMRPSVVTANQSRPETSSKFGLSCVPPLTSSFRALSVSPINEKLKGYRVEEQLGLAAPPPKPVTPYLRWAIENRAKIAEKAPLKNFTALGSYMGKLWSEMPDEEKKPYQQGFEKEMEAYKEKKEKYLASLTESEKEAIAQAKRVVHRARQERKAKISVKRRIKDLDKPKKPVSPFMLYSLKRRKELAGVDTKDFMKKMGAEWKMLTPDKKAPFEEEFKKAMKAYMPLLEAWEEKMISLGYSDVVRASSRLFPDDAGSVRRKKTPEALDFHKDSPPAAAKPKSKTVKKV